MLGEVKKIVFLVFVLLGCAVFAYEQQILQESNLDDFVLLLEKKDLRKQDIYLIISKLEYLGTHNPDAYVLLGDLYLQNKLFCPGMTTLAKEERIKRAIQYYHKAENKSIVANLRLASVYANDRERSLTYMLNAAVLGDSTAKQKIAEAIEAGWQFSDLSLTNRARNILGLEPIRKNPPQNLDAIFNPSSAASAESASYINEADSAKKNKSTDSTTEIYDTPYSNPPHTPSVNNRVFEKINKVLNVNLLQSIAIRFALLGLVGLIFASCKKVYLFYNLADVIVSSVISLLLLGIFISIFNGDGYNENFFTYSVITVALLIALIPSAIVSNPGAWWSFLIVVPAKAILGCLGIIAALGSVGKLMETINNKKDRGTNFIVTLIFGAMAYGIYKLMMKTTRNR